MPSRTGSRIVWRAASAARFQCRHVARFSLTAAMTLAPSAAISSRGTSSARSARCAGFAVAVYAQLEASVPSTFAARSRHSAVRSASERTSFAGRVASVACARSFMIVAGLGRRPCACTNASIRRSVSASMWRDRVENSRTSDSGTAAIAHAGWRSRPRSRCSHCTPSSRVSASANSASCNSESATTAACIGRPSSERHLPSSTVCTLLLITTCVCRCGSPARLSK